MVRLSYHRLVVVTWIQGGIGALAAFSAGCLAVLSVRDCILSGHRCGQSGCSNCCNNDGGSERGCQKPPGPWLAVGAAVVGLVVPFQPSRSGKCHERQAEGGKVAHVE